jgi:hypothetical protein
VSTVVFLPIGSAATTSYKFLVRAARAALTIAFFLISSAATSSHLSRVRPSKQKSKNKNKRQKPLFIFTLLTVKLN